MLSYIQDNHIISQITPNIFIGNYLSVDDKIINYFNIKALIIAAHDIESDCITSHIPILRLGWMEVEEDDIFSGLIKSFGLIEEKTKSSENVLVLCRFGMNRSVSVVLGWLMLYMDKTIDESIVYVKSARSIICPIPLYQRKVSEAISKIKEEFSDWKTVKTSSISEILDLLSYDIGDFHRYTGTYPMRFHSVSSLTDDVIRMRGERSLVDRAKNPKNRLRKDQPIELIDRNEKECLMLLSGYYGIPKMSRVDIMNKVVLTRDFILDLEDDAIVNTANEALMGGGGMDMLIHTYAGESLKMETSSLPNVIEGDYYYGVKCLTGDAKITSGHNLRSRYIIHVVTPYLNEDGTPNKQAHVNSYKSIFKFIDGHHIRKLSMGPLSTGYYGYPMVEATILGLMTLRKFLMEHYDKVDRINIWIPNETQHRIYEYLIYQMI